MTSLQHAPAVEVHVEHIEHAGVVQSPEPVIEVTVLEDCDHLSPCVYGDVAAN